MDTKRIAFGNNELFLPRPAGEDVFGHRNFTTSCLEFGRDRVIVVDLDRTDKGIGTLLGCG